MLRVFRYEWLNESGDERELMRLELVGLASEIAAVAHHAQGKLPPEGYSPRADGVRQQCRFLLRSAHRVLSHDAALESLSTSQLREAVDSLRGLQRKLAALRSQGDFTTSPMLSLAVKIIHGCRQQLGRGLADAKAGAGNRARTL